MKGVTSWQCHPYIRPSEPERALDPFICRIIPRECGFTCEWLDQTVDQGIRHFIGYRACNSGDAFIEKEIVDSVTAVDGLQDRVDYEVYVRRGQGDSKSPIRLVRTGAIPGTVINYLHPDDDCYEFSGHALGSPGIIRLPSGNLLASMDVFCDRTSWPSDPVLALLYESCDEGKSWHYLNDIFPAFWPLLFLHRGSLYLLAGSSDYSNMIIGRSDDEGKTWTTPVTLFRGEGPKRWGCHHGVTPVVEHEGRLYFAMEFGHVRVIKYLVEYDLSHRPGVISIDSDADLLDPANWRCTPFFYPETDPKQCIEGNIVVLPDGKMRNCLRTMIAGKSLLLRIDEQDPEAPLSFDRVMLDFPLSAVSKFHILHDPTTGYYIAIGNEYNPELGISGRSVMSMAISSDFLQWQVVHRILDGRSTGAVFSYPTWIFDGDNILIASRTAYNGAKNGHDTNLITFHRLLNYRQYLPCS